MGDALNKAFALGNFIEENNGSYMTDTINKINHRFCFFISDIIFI